MQSIIDSKKAFIVDYHYYSFLSLGAIKVVLLLLNSGSIFSYICMELHFLRVVHHLLLRFLRSKFYCMDNLPVGEVFDRGFVNV